MRSTVDKEKDVKYNIVDGCAGGVFQEKKELIVDSRGQIFKQKILPIEMGERMVKSNYEIIQNKFTRLDCPITLNPQDSTFDDVAMHALFRQRLSLGTVEKRMRYARFMEKHLKSPVDFRNPSYENFIKHMDYREQIDFDEGKGASALHNEWKTMKMFLKAYGMPIWDYKPPSRPRSKSRYIPSPDTVFKMIHYIYDSDDYINALVQYTLCHAFMIGWRNPSETCVLSVEDVNIDEGTLKITEPKKHYSTRTVVPGYSLMAGKNRKSFKFWIDHWRPQVENQHSGDSLYLRKDGRPIKSNQYRMIMSRLIKPVFPLFSLYCTRHWCSIALLIRTKIKTNNFDVYPVRNWLGHTDIQTTMAYLRDAEQHIERGRYDWFQRVLKYTKKVGDNTLKSVQRQNWGVLTEIPPRKVNGPTGIRTPVTGSEGQ